MSKNLQLINGSMVEVADATTSTGAGDAGKTVALNSAGKIDETMLPAVDVSSIEASEDIGAGDFINIHESTGTKIRLADRENGRPANGFVNSAIATGASGTVFFEGRNTAKTGMTAGQIQFLGVAGNTTSVAPTTAGLCQKLGTAFSTTEMTTEISQPITQI